MAKIYERFATGREALNAANADPALHRFAWAQFDWLYLDDVPGESRLAYLKRMEAARILKGDGYKEIKRLEKAAAKEVK